MNYNKLLNRDVLTMDIDSIKASFVGKVILVTGGGGSIGSEICRYIAKLNPKQILIFDMYENNVYFLERELKKQYLDLNIKIIIGNIQDYNRLEEVFEEHNIDQVFHAAAYKHVPLMELNPSEAVKNNCLGTYNLAKLSKKYGVKKFVLISTDKAVNPINVMGASKRICEKIIQVFNDMKTDTVFLAVRFGNVLGSNGSAIPLFIKQIDDGGPVTITDKEMTRYFITIDEAVKLVLESSTLAQGGEIFVLDMGKQVKIYDIIKELVFLKGLTLDRDIKLEIIGLRQGEKLREELTSKNEILLNTSSKNIFYIKPKYIDNKKFISDLDDLIKKAHLNSKDIKEYMNEIAN